MIAGRLDDVTKCYPAGPALDELTFEVRGGEVVALLGHSGAGKTTLLHALAGLVDVDAGSAHAVSPRFLVQAVPVRAPDLVDSLSDLTVAGDITTVAGTGPVGSLVLADHPFEFLHQPWDWPLADATHAAMRSLAGAGMGVLFTTHLRSVAGQADRRAALDHGRLVSDGADALRYASPQSARYDALRARPRPSQPPPTPRREDLVGEIRRRCAGAWWTLMRAACDAWLVRSVNASLDFLSPFAEVVTLDADAYRLLRRRREAAGSATFQRLT